MEPVFTPVFFAAASVMAALSERDLSRAKETTLGLSRKRLMSATQMDEMYRDFVRYSTEESEDYESWASRRGVRLLGEGAGRVVIQIPNGAMKLAKDGYGEDSNHSEVIVWNRSPQWMRELLVPVIDHSLARKTGDRRMGWILMDQVYPWDWSKRIERTTGERILLKRDLDRQRLFLKRKLNPFGIDDIRKSNMSLDGRLMDYGFVSLSAFREEVSRSS